MSDVSAMQPGIYHADLRPLHFSATLMTQPKIERLSVRQHIYILNIFGLQTALELEDTLMGRRRTATLGSQHQKRRRPTVSPQDGD